MKKKKISEFLSEKFQFLEVQFSIYLNRCVFVMKTDGMFERYRITRSSEGNGYTYKEGRKFGSLLKGFIIKGLLLFFFRLK